MLRSRSLPTFLATMMLAISPAGVTLAAQAPSGHANIKPDPVMLRASAVRDRFIAAMEACGAKPAYLPNIVADTPGDGIDYDDGDHAVHISRWSKLDPGVKQAMQGWAEQSTLGLDPEGMWGEIFNEFLVAHELGHYMEFMAGKTSGHDEWQGEVDADLIALAFWSAAKTDAARLPSRVENFNKFLLSLPSPVPTGQDARTYFHADYDELTKNLGAYGWYQGQFMKTAWERRPSRSFCDWVHANPPVKPSSSLNGK